MIDHHCHLLPHLDDGAADLDEALEMARLLASVGFHQVYCTPHCIKGLYDNDARQVREAVRALQQAVDAAEIPLLLSPGMEYYLDEFFPRQLDDLLPLGDTNLVLVEAPTQGHLELIKDNIFLLVRKGYIPLVAHPERSPLFDCPARQNAGFWRRLLGKFSTQDSGLRTQDSGLNPQPSALSPQHSALSTLTDMSCLFQGNLGSQIGQYGRDVQNKSKAWQRQGLYSHLGTDAHDVSTLELLTRAGILE